MPLIDSLVEDCLLKIFELLDFEDLMNVAETCKKFEVTVGGLFKKYSKFKLNDCIAPTQIDEQTDRILMHTGRYITSLQFICCDEYTCSRLLKWIPCRKLKHLDIAQLKPSCLNVLSLHSFDNLESMNLFSCDLDNLMIALKDLRKLKTLNIFRCIIGIDNLKMILQNNPEIESFVFKESREKSTERNDFDCQLLQIIPRVRKLALCCENGIIYNVDLIPGLDCLTTLQINCNGFDITEFISKLAQKSLLKELELHLVQFDESFINVLKEFVNLEVLHVDNVSYGIFKNTSPVWPPNIKQLHLNSIIVSARACASMIRQLKSLERLDVFVSFPGTNADTLFEKIDKLLGNRKQKLYMSLPWCYKYTFGGKASEYYNRLSIESDRLKLFHGEEYENNSMGIHAMFPGIGWGLNCSTCSCHAKSIYE